MAHFLKKFIIPNSQKMEKIVNYQLTQYLLLLVGNFMFIHMDLRFTEVPLKIGVVLGNFDFLAYLYVTLGC